MFSNKRLFVPVTMVLSSFFGVFAARAQPPQPPQCYNLASLQGSYGMVGYYTGGIALAMAVEYFDGNGNMTRNAIVNQPPAATAAAGAPRAAHPNYEHGDFHRQLRRHWHVQPRDHELDDWRHVEHHG